MGRLFWKFFLAIWLVLLLAALGVGSIVWFHKPDQPAQDPFLATGPRVAFDLQMAATVLATGGEAALRALMAEAEDKFPFPLRVTDENGTELLGRPVGKAALAQAQRMAEKPSGPAVARRVTLSDGRRLLLFVPLDALPPWPVPPGHAPPGRSSAEHRPPPGGRLPGPPPWLPLLFGLGASLCVSALLAWYVAKPIRLLRQALDQAAGGQLNIRVQPLIGRRRDELADLGRNFDHMAQRLQSLLDAQRRLLHDVSHELRSPLARIQAAVGLAVQHPDRVQESLERVERETRRLDELVGEVLTLARLESMPAGELEDIVDLNGVLSEVVADARYEAQAKGVAIAFQSQGEMVIRGRTELIYRAVENVLRNAVRHTPAPGTVALAARAEASGRRLCIEVRDQGPGVPSEELAMIFQPFFRGQDRRVASEKGYGYGLGLAIAQRAVAAHGGIIRAENTPPAGLCVRIELRGWAAQDGKN